MATFVQYSENSLSGVQAKCTKVCTTCYCHFSLNGSLEKKKSIDFIEVENPNKGSIVCEKNDNLF